MMRALVLSLALSAAALPAAAQDFGAVNQFQLDELRFQQQMLQQRSIAQANELMALEAQVRTDQAIRQLDQARAPVRLPQLPYPGAPPAMIDVSKLPSIPDAMLAESNKRVREAAQNRR